MNDYQRTLDELCKMCRDEINRTEALQAALAAKQSELETLRAHSREQSSLLDAALERVGELERAVVDLRNACELVEEHHIERNTEVGRPLNRSRTLAIVQKALASTVPFHALAKKGAADV